MPLPGGAADKFGNRYEGRLTVYNMARILNEEATSIFIEPVGDEGTGVEFVLTFPDDSKEYHQIKRQHGGQGAWTISSLESERVLSNFRGKLKSPNTSCVFTSTSSSDHLQELTERARDSQSIWVFRSHFLQAERIKTNFENLKKKWENCDDEEAYDLLNRIFVDAISEHVVRREVAFRLSALIEGSPDAASAVLAGLALDSIHKELATTDIWRHLKDSGFERRVWNNDPHVLAAIAAANDRYISPLYQQTILASPIERPEAEIAQNKLKNGKKILLVTGNAGNGKSVVGCETFRAMLASGWNCLAFRMDRLEPVETARQIGEQLDLPESPVTVLANIAQGKDSLLLIDQVDAVSAASGRHPHFFERVDEMIRQSNVHSKMRVALVCRSFDFENDERLRRLRSEGEGAEEIRVGPLKPEMVNDVLKACYVDPNELGEKQLSFLTIPLHLKIFTDLALSDSDSIPDLLNFSSLKDLFDLYWEKKYSAVKNRLGREPNWGQLIDAAISRMMTNHALSMPQSVLDDFASERAAMLSEGILVQDGKRISFFHETFFDYAFARRFISSGKDILSFLRSGEQHLFLRATLRQVLTHMRVEDYEIYLRDLRELLTAPDVRIHLKQIILHLLGSLPSPTRDEWFILRALLTDSSFPLAEEIWSAISTPAWYDIIEANDFLKNELEGNDTKRIEKIVNYLARMARDIPDKAAKIANTFSDKSEPWPRYALTIFANAKMDRGMVDLYLRFVKNGAFDPMAYPFSAYSSSPQLYSLPEKKPEWGIEILESWLQQHILASEKNSMRPLESMAIDDNPGVMKKMAETAPDLFVEKILPIILGMITRNARHEGTPPWKDHIWQYPLYGGHSLRDSLMEAIVTALSKLAIDQPDLFLRHAEVLRQNAEFETVGFILCRAYAANGERFSNDGTDFILGDSRWFQLGWTDSPYWVSRELLQAISPYCSNERLESLETAILSFYSPWEMKNPKSMGLTQLALLNGFAEERRSPNIKRRLGELQRKFDIGDYRPPSGIQTAWAGPPFNANWKKMSDDQWLKAIEQYKDDNHTDPFKGGARELASALKECAKTQPERFAQLLTRIPVNSNPVYFDFILLGLSESEQIDVAIVEPAIKTCASLPGQPCGRFISSVVEKYADASLSSDILDILGAYATESPDPDREIWRVPSPDGTLYYGGDFEQAGLNSVRGAMAYTFSTILFAKPERFTQLRPYIERMVSDKSMAVRSQVAHALLPIQNIEKDVAVSLFIQLCQKSSDSLLKIRYVEEFLYHAIGTHWVSLQPLIERMIDSSNGEVVRTGARMASLAAIGQKEAEALADCCSYGSETMRQSAAEIVAANINSGINRTRCENQLCGFFNDQFESVREAAASCFQYFQDDQLGQYGQLLESFIDSKAFGEHDYEFFHALERTTAILPDIVCHACERKNEVVNKAGLPDFQKIDMFDRVVRPIIIRLYEGTHSADVKTRCLDIIDLLIRNQPYAMGKALTERE